MSALSDKILSLNPQYYYKANQAWSTTPTNLGSVGNVAWTISNEAPILNSTGGIDGEGSWILNMTNGGTDTTPTQVRIPSGTLTQFQDHDYTAGFWFKTNFTMTSSLAHDSSYNLFWVAGYGRYFSVSITGGAANNANKGKLSVIAQAATTLSGSGTTSFRVDDQQWHFFSVRVVDTGSAGDIYYYIDGTQIYNGYYAKTTSGINYFQFGDSSAVVTGTGASDLTTIEIANMFAAPSANITGTDIADIYQQGINPQTNISVSALPLEASALQTEPTIAVTAGDHVEVTTSILVDASMGNAVAQTGQFVNITITGTLDAAVEMINNVEIDTSSDTSFSALEMIASAEILQPFVARSPMFATAESGNHSVYVTPSYYALVKQSNPLYYFNFDTPTGANYGTMSIASYTKGSTMSTGQTSGGDMGLVGAGLSWAGTGNYNNAPNYFRVYPTASSDISNLVSSRNFTIEIWSKGESEGVAGFGNISIFKSRVTISKLISRTNPNWPDDGGTQYITEAYIDNSVLYKNNDWNHYVVRVAPGSGTNELIVSWYLNGSFAGSATDTLDPTLFTSSTWDNFAAGGSGDNVGTADYVDEFAVYGSALSNSTIIDHHSFINVLSPDRTIFPLPITAFAESGTHNFIINSNAAPEVTVSTASALIVNPTTIAGVSNDITVDVLTANATIVQSSTQYGNTAIAQPLNGYAESNNAFALSDTYYNYVMANVNPYRYVTFDGSNSFLDYGSDNDYAVAPVVVGGTVVNPDFGINGKSAKTAGTSYIADGVILKESEYNDTWGTGLNNYHSSFWFRKADEDNSTGLRVLWNLNGHYDNQHVILYQYQNKLHLQFNNGSGSYIDQATVLNYNLFDGLRHFIVVAFDHTGSNNRVNLFVDGIDVMEVLLGTYNGTTINGTVSVPANDEANNHPRLSVGCLITPFGSTALPVVPTNTIIYVDEIIWAKTSASQELVSNLYGMMPGQTNEVIPATVMTASALLTTPAISTSVDYDADWALAEAGPIDAFVSVIRNISINATALTASAVMESAAVSWPANIIADIMVATAIFNSAGVRITIPGGPMVATVELLDRPYEGIYITTDLIVGSGFSAQKVNTSYFYTLSKWASWLRSTDSGSILPTREIR
jgi:hypothetical protein